MAVSRRRASTSQVRRPTIQVAAPGGGGFSTGLNLPVGVTDITPGVPAFDVQIVDPRNFVINNMTGRPAKLVPIGAKIQRRRRPRFGRGLSASKVADLIRESNQNQFPLMLALMMAGRH